MFQRRTLLTATAAATACRCLPSAHADADGFQFRYSLASCMYGYTPIEQILPEAKKCGATGIDLWPKVHGNQREQLDEMGEEHFTELLNQHELKLSIITQYKLGPFGIDDEIRLAGRLGCHTVVTGGQGPKNLKGAELKTAIADFLRRLEPTLNLARDHGVRLAIENHGNNLIHDADSLRYLADLGPRDAIGVALAPYHLPQNPEQIASLIEDVGDSLSVFYAWQHGRGSTKKLPKEQELLQMPGRGDLDFAPLVRSLARISFAGWTEIFMHPVPRGVPILDSTAAVTEEINRGRRYLESLT
ncbi:sugar phosphate isomerase/epimerase [Roseiconus nitratireducens]|uniref:Sugar phosphate isomerase/epimerase n=1 Tax=Roseiconus nitratireducens TaxID=2605748 RepID=A0A5M6D7X9_9BACT|nr:sugar phosphate isomerase/epimerase family protein [Roseiconus nitratireducens]KAA5543654.1 sugar phosphate isomerase/epimerase [Roseiconus nitratireducens]